MGRLDAVDLAATLDRTEAERRLNSAQRRLLALRLTLGGQISAGQTGPPLLVIFEGWDASGKGGAIKRLVDPLDARHYSVHQFAAPTARDKRHHFLWRFWPKLPGDGGMVLFDRSWYGRVLVERVEELATEDQWTRAYREIRDLERMLTAEGMLIIKFWMQISSEEQLRRFEARRDSKLKRWKLTDDDWRNRGLRELYEPAVEEMLEETDRPNAAWHVVPAESKRSARVFVLETVCEQIEASLTQAGIPLPLELK